MLGPQNGNSLLFPPFTGQKGDQSKGKENQSAKVSSAGKTNKDSDVKEVGMLWERKVSGRCRMDMVHALISEFFDTYNICRNFKQRGSTGG